MKQRDLIRQGSDILGLDPRLAAKRFDELDLSRRIELVLAMPPDRRRLDLILLSARPALLVRALPPEDFILTVKEIGEADSGELFELSSDEQTTYLSDLELFVRGGIDLGRLAYLNETFFRCSRERMLRWIKSLDFEVLVLMFERTLLPIDKESIESLSDRLAARVTTPDGYHYLLVKLGADFELVKKLADFIYIEDQELFMALIGNMGTTPPAEVEQQATHWRDARLADRGWPDLESAAQIYRPRRPEQTGQVRLPAGVENPPRFALQPGLWGSLLDGGLNAVEDPASQAGQLANLINRVVIADGLLPTELDALRLAGERVKGYMEIGLAVLGARDAESAGRTMAQIPLLHVFQVAWESLCKRAARARELRGKVPAKMLELLDEPLADVLAQTAARRPLFLPEAELVAREYRDLGELSQTDSRLDLAEALLSTAAALDLDVDRLPDPFPPGAQPESPQALKLSCWLLTVFARERMDLGDRHQPFPRASLAQLFESLPGAGSALERELGAWAGKHLIEPPAGLGAMLAKLQKLAVELLGHDAAALDPRFVEGLWIA